MSNNKQEQSNKYREYLERKHSGFNTNPALIAKMVGKAVSSNVLSNERVVEGEINEVHKVQTNSGDKVVVRISRSSNPRFETERWAIEQARRAGVSAPEVLLVERQINEGKQLTFCIEKEVPGIPLKDYLAKIGPESKEAQEVIENVGETLAKIHSVKTKGFGNLNPDGTGQKKSWKEYMTKWSGRSTKLTKAAEAIGLSQGDIKKAIEIIEENSDLFNNIQPSLLHGDYGVDHVFIENGTVSGVIDFESCKGGDPTWDFSWWSYFGRNKPPVDWLKNGYKRLRTVDENFDKRIRLGEIRLGLDMVEYYYQEKNEAGMDLAKRRLQELITN